MQTKLLEKYVHTLLEFNFETGEMWWKPRTLEFYSGSRALQACNAWNTKYAGKKAFNSLNILGYLEGSFKNRRFLAHRVIWLGKYGVWPSNIDHINHVKTDNRISNLREVSLKENNKNLTLRSTNSSGVTGVMFSKGRWRAYINHDSKSYHLGTFASKAEACNARLIALEKFHFHPNHGK